MATELAHKLWCNNDEVLHLNSAHGDLYSEYFITCELSASEDVCDLEHKYQQFVEKLVQYEITPVHEKVFACLSFLSSFLGVQSRLYRTLGFSSNRIPFSYIEGAPVANGARWAGVQLYGIRVQDPSQVEVKDIVGQGGSCGKIIESRDARQVLFTGLNGVHCLKSGSVGGKNEIENVFSNLDVSLRNAGFQMSDLARTWFHLRDILPAYNEFNQARKDSYTGRIDRERLPASTAIQGKPAFGREIVLDALAIQPKNGNGPIVRTMTSPAQPEAQTYGPLFSRGIEITWPGYKILHVSGTAGIDESGRSVHTEDPALQVSHTLNAISLLLNKYGATMNDIVQASAYFKTPELEPIFNNILKMNNWDDMPCLRMLADVCRDDLFFEMDCIAIVHF